MLERNKLLRDIDSSESKQDFAIIMTFMMTGIRVSGLVSLDRDNVKISEGSGTLTVRAGKGNKERTVPLNAEGGRAIQKSLTERSDTHLAMFISNWQERISLRSVQRLHGVLPH